MKKILSFILSFILIMGILTVPIKAEAATLSSKVGVVSLKSGNLNVRSSASTSSTVVTRIPNSSYITLILKSGNWWYVEYGDNKFGYCHADYIKIVNSTAKSVKIQSGTLNVRSGAGTNYSRLASLSKNEVVLVLSESNGWSKILYNGNKTGYVSSKYLSSTDSSTSSAVKLNVPSFKQTDPRWANVKIGTSGKTIAQIGCVTTAIAMMESYRTGTTIYPDAMSKKLSYSSSGNVYWPSNLIVTTSSQNYLNRIYDLLKQGKPVLFGAKNSYGAQHWVVITGFSGGNITASSFTINDPGSNARTSLQQFLNAYPNFYKYFHY